jgi:hypothetical protein
VGDGILGVSVGDEIGRHASGGLAKDGDSCGIAAEAGDIVAGPFQGKTLVEEPCVSDFAGRSGEAEDVQSVVEGYDYNVIFVSED